MKRGQTATEYLVILAIIIVIALVVVSILGGSLRIGSPTSESITSTQLRFLDVGVLNVYNDGNIVNFRVMNNLPRMIRIIDISLNGESCISSEFILNIASHRDINCSQGGDLSDLEIEWAYEGSQNSFIISQLINTPKNLENNLPTFLDLSGEECFNSDNVGLIGSWLGCEGMLIVNNQMLRDAGSDLWFPSGDGSFEIIGPDSNLYTFGNSDYNIFTGQVTDISGLFSYSTFNEDISY